MRHSIVAAFLLVGAAGPAWADAAGDLKQGKDALRNGNYAGAITKLTGAIDSGGLQGDRLGEAYRVRGAAHFQLRDLRPAFIDASQALVANPKDAAAMGLRCQIHVAGGNLAAAETDLKAAQALNPKAGAAQLCQAGMNVRQRRFADAVSAFDKAMALGEDTPNVRANRAVALAMSGKPQDAIAALDKVIGGSRSAAPVERAGWLADRARLHAATGKPDLALKDLNDAIKLDPANAQEGAERQFLRARLHNERGQFDQALADLNAVIAAEQNAPDPRKALLFATRASSYAGQGDFARAIADIDGAITLARDVPPSVVGSWYVLRARANRAAGRPDMALQDYAAGLKVAPGDVELLGERGDVLLRQGKADEALADFQTAVQRAPNNPLAHSWLGWGFAEKGNYPKAIESAAKVIALRPQESLGYWDRGLFHFLQGRFSEATVDLDQAATLAPRNANAALLAHVARARAGDKRPEYLAERAKGLDLNQWPGPLVRMFIGQTSPDEVLKATEKQPSAEALFYVGQYHLIEGQASKAADLFRKAVATNQRQHLEHTAARVELDRIRG